MDSFGAGAAFHRPTSAIPNSCAYRAGIDGARVRMNVASHQEKEKNEKACKREAGEERKRVTNFKEAVCCPSAVVQ